MKAPFDAVSASSATDFHCPSRAQESVDSPISNHGKARKAGCFLKAYVVPSVFFFFFFFAPATSRRKSPCAGLQWNEPGLRSRESVQLTLVGQMKKPLSIESWRNIYSERLQRKRRKGCARSADRAANTQCACEGTMSVEIIPFKKLVFPRLLGLVFFFLSSPLDEQCSNLSLENPNLMNRSQNSP